MSNIGIVLTGGGAHAAYQAGVLRAIAEITHSPVTPFKVITGVSAGAINAMSLASGATNFQATTRLLWNIWSQLRPSDVFRTDIPSLMGIGARWIRDLSLGGFLGDTRSSFLLNTEPLAELINKYINFEEIDRNLASGLVHSVAVTSTNYITGSAISFFDGPPEIEPWYRGTRISKRTKIRLHHIMASSAIPIFFSPVYFDGSYYGDGCVRLNAPLSPAIHLNAHKILAIGTHHSYLQNKIHPLNEIPSSEVLGFIEIIGLLLNAVFLDSLEFDMDRMQRVNRTLSYLSPQQIEASRDKLRPISLASITPSQRLGNFASEELLRFPAALRHLLRGLGASEGKGWDVLSYLAFDGGFTQYLLELGFQDALRQKELILSLLSP